MNFSYLGIMLLKKFVGFDHCLRLNSFESLVVFREYLELEPTQIKI